MLKLTDGRNHLYQWDTGRKAEVTLQCDEVHFFNISCGTAISIKVTDGVVSIPDELLRSGVDIRYWAFVGTVESGYTMRGGRIEVVKRPKPSDYVYTETEVVTIETAVKNALEKAKESGDFPECDVTSVNGQTGDVQTRLLVTITKNEDGTYTSSHTSQEIYAASQAGAVIEGANISGDGERYLTYLCSEQFVQFLAMSVSGGSGKRSLNTRAFLINGDKVILGTTQTPIPQAPANMVGATASAAGTAGLVPKPAAGDQGKYLKGDGTWANIDCVRNPNTAEVGQTIVVKSVDENGKPTEWEAADFPKEVWEKINEITVDEVVDAVEITTDHDGNPFSLKKMYIFLTLPKYDYDGATGTGYPSFRINGYDELTAPSSGWENKELHWTIEAHGNHVVSDFIVHDYDGAWKNFCHKVFWKREDETFYESIHSIKWALFDRKVLAGTKIEIYGVRA